MDNLLQSRTCVSTIELLPLCTTLSCHLCYVLERGYSMIGFGSLWCIGYYSMYMMQCRLWRLRRWWIFISHWGMNIHVCRVPDVHDHCCHSVNLDPGDCVVSPIWCRQSSFKLTTENCAVHQDMYSTFTQRLFADRSPAIYTVSNKKVDP